MSSAMDTSPATRKRIHAVSQRRQNKPLIEKRRRARINECLLQLKALLMKDMGKESPRPSKLEKADILEMTVDYIKKLADKKPELSSIGCHAAVENKPTNAPFLDGFSRCMEEVDTFLDNQLHLLPEVRLKLLTHCRDKLTAKDVKVEDCQATKAGVPAVSPALPHPLTSPSSSILQGSASPDSCDLSGGNRSACDSGSEGSFSDEEGKATRTCISNDAKLVAKPELLTTTATSTTADNNANNIPASATATTTAAATTTALVAPFHHHASSSPAVSSGVPSPVTTTSAQGTANNGGIKLAGPLKLICGGNVFIVVDQQQQQLQHPQQPQPQPQQQQLQLQQQQQLQPQLATSPYGSDIIGTHQMPAASASAVPVPMIGGHLLYGPGVYSASTAAAYAAPYLSALPAGVKLAACSGQAVTLSAAGTAVASVPLITSNLSASPCAAEQHKLQTLNQGAMAPPPPSSPPLAEIGSTGEEAGSSSSYYYSSSSPVPPPYPPPPEVLESHPGNDINNNPLGLVPLGSSMWRPW